MDTFLWSESHPCVEQWHKRLLFLLLMEDDFIHDNRAYENTYRSNYRFNDIHPDHIFSPPLAGQPVLSSLPFFILYISTYKQIPYKQTVATRRTVSNRHILANMRSLYIYIYNDGSSLKKSNEMGTIIRFLSSIYLLITCQQRM
jgi:hypothetical protein